MIGATHHSRSIICSASHCFRGHKDWDGEAFSKLWHCHPDGLYPFLVLAQVGLNPRCRWRFPQNYRVTNQDTNIIAVFVCVETQGHSWILREVPQLSLVSFAENQNRVTVPVKPDRPGLGCILRVDGCKLDDLFLAEAAVDSSPGSSCEFKHRTASICHDRVTNPGGSVDYFTINTPIMPDL